MTSRSSVREKLANDDRTVGDQEANAGLAPQIGDVVGSLMKTMLIAEAVYFDNLRRRKR